MVPREWKEAKIILIPKRAKAKNFQNLRPISLTSCLGKLFEKVVLTRLTAHIESNQLFPTSMFGFRPHLSAQDIFLMLKDEVLNPSAGSSDRIVVALDLKKAFDTISHQLILEELKELACGARKHTPTYALFCKIARPP